MAVRPLGPALTLGTYLVGWVVLSGAIAPHGWAAVEIRRWLLSNWRGPWARLAEIVLTAVLVLLEAEALGSVGGLRRLPLVVVGVGAGVGIALFVRRLPRRPGTPEPVPVAADPWAWVGAAIAVGGVTAQWFAWTGQALRQGMTAYDAVFYHGPMAARFAQSGDLTRLHAIVPGEAVTFYPATTEAWHAIGIVAFHSDLASPVMNLAALAVAFLAAWCLGRWFGGSPAAVAAVALICAVPYVAASQPGSSFNDAPALAALLAAAALFARAVGVSGGFRPGGDLGAGTIAALGAGLAAGMKLSFVAPAALLTLAAASLVARGRRMVTAAAWVLVMIAAGGYWYARNLLRVGNPLPGLGLGLPSPSLPVDRQYGTRLLTSLDLSGHGWRTLYRVGIQDYFGRAWPGLLAVIVVALIVGITASRRAPWHRAVAIAASIAVVAYTVTPVTGDPAFFRFNLRYTLPIQGLALLVAATMPMSRGKWAQRVLVGLAVIAIAVVWPGPPAGHTDIFEVGGWPPATTHRLAAVGLAIAILSLIGVGYGLWRLVPHRLTAAAICAVGTIAVILSARGVTERYERGRYVRMGGELGPAWQWARSVTHSRIGVVGLYQQYPFAGTDLTNYVQYVGLATPHGGLARAGSCAEWRRSVNAGRYRFIVTSREGIFPPPGEPSEARWTRTDGATKEILHTGDTAVFEIRGPLDPAGC